LTLQEITMFKTLTSTVRTVTAVALLGLTVAAVQASTGPLAERVELIAKAASAAPSESHARAHRAERMPNAHTAVELSGPDERPVRCTNRLWC
jgi:hypothetical protein